MYGKAVKAGYNVENAQLVDLAPTVLALMGEPVPPDMDGRVLTEAFRKAYLTACPVRYAEKVEEGEIEAGFADESAYSDEDEDQVLERLKELGYL
jgi:arylsulfatase A-like enzyme